VKQNIGVRDKKKRTPVSGNYSDIVSAELVIKYLCINLQITKINNIAVDPLIKYYDRRFILIHR